MKWALIVRLSLFGFAMGFINLFLADSVLNPSIWIFIYLFSAYIIAKKCVSEFFLHGLLLGMFDNIWLVVVKNIFRKIYLQNAKGLIYQYDSVTKTFKFKGDDGTVLRQIFVGGSVALISGLVLGILTFCTAKLFKYLKSRRSY